MRDDNFSQEPQGNMHDSVNKLLQDYNQPAAEKNVAPQAAPEATDIAEEVPAPNPGKKEPVNKYISPDLSAELIIGSIDMVQTMTFSAIAKRKMRRRLGDDLERLESVVDAIEAGTMNKADVQQADLIKLKKVRKLIAVMDDVPFTDAEKEDLKKPLAAIIEEAGYQIPPSVAFIIAVSTVLGPRVADALTE